MSWIGVSGFLISWATWRAISAHASSRCVRSSSSRCRRSSERHHVERFHQPAKFVGCGGRDARIEVPPCDAARRTHQAVHRVRDPLRQRVAERRADEDEQHRREDDAAVEVVDLALDLLLPEGERHGEDRIAPACADRGGRHHVAEAAHLFLGDDGGQAVEGDGAIDVRGRARGQQARGEQVPLARRLSASGAAEEVDVLADDAAQPDHRVVVERRLRARGRAARCTPR